MAGNNPHSPGLTEAQCDSISETSALHVLRQVKGILAGAAERELHARARAGQTHLDPFYAYSGPVAGCFTAAISALWSMMNPDEDPANAATSLRGLLMSMLDAQLEGIVAAPPGEEMARIMAAETKRKRGMA